MGINQKNLIDKVVFIAITEVSTKEDKVQPNEVLNSIKVSNSIKNILKSFLTPTQTQRNAPNSDSSEDNIKKDNIKKEKTASEEKEDEKKITIEDGDEKILSVEKIKEGQITLNCPGGKLKVKHVPKDKDPTTNLRRWASIPKNLSGRKKHLHLQDRNEGNRT